MPDSKIVLRLFEVIGERPEVFPHPQLFLGRVVEDVVGDLVPQPAAAEKIVRDDLGEDLVQPFVEGVTHGAT